MEGQKKIIPREFKDIIANLKAYGYPHEVDQDIINEYTGQQGIDRHVDRESFDRGVATVSLNGWAPLVMWPPNQGTPISMWMEPRSALILQGEARYKWSHSVPKTAWDRDDEGQWWRRSRRISITLRGVRHPTSRNWPHQQLTAPKLAQAQSDGEPLNQKCQKAHPAEPRKTTSRTTLREANQKGTECPRHPPETPRDGATEAAKEPRSQAVETDKGPNAPKTPEEAQRTGEPLNRENPPATRKPETADRPEIHHERARTTKHEQPSRPRDYKPEKEHQEPRTPRQTTSEPTRGKHPGNPEEAQTGDKEPAKASKRLQYLVPYQGDGTAFTKPRPHLCGDPKVARWRPKDDTQQIIANQTIWELLPKTKKGDSSTKRTRPSGNGAPKKRKKETHRLCRNVRWIWTTSKKHRNQAAPTQKHKGSQPPGTQCERSPRTTVTNNPSPRPPTGSGIGRRAKSEEPRRSASPRPPGGKTQRTTPPMGHGEPLTLGRRPGPGPSYKEPATPRRTTKEDTQKPEDAQDDGKSQIEDYPPPNRRHGEPHKATTPTGQGEPQIPTGRPGKKPHGGLQDDTPSAGKKGSPAPTQRPKGDPHENNLTATGATRKDTHEPERTQNSGESQTREHPTPDKQTREDNGIITHAGQGEPQTPLDRATGALSGHNSTSTPKVSRENTRKPNSPRTKREIQTREYPAPGDGDRKTRRASTPTGRGEPLTQAGRPDESQNDNPTPTPNAALKNREVQERPNVTITVYRESPAGKEMHTTHGAATITEITKQTAHWLGIHPDDFRLVKKRDHTYEVWPRARGGAREDTVLLEPKASGTTCWEELKDEALKERMSPKWDAQIRGLDCAFNGKRRIYETGNQVRYMGTYSVRDRELCEYYDAQVTPVRSEERAELRLANYFAWAREAGNPAPTHDTSLTWKDWQTVTMTGDAQKITDTLRANYNFTVYKCEEWRQGRTHLRPALRRTLTDMRDMEERKLTMKLMDDTGNWEYQEPARLGAAVQAKCKLCGTTEGQATREWILHHNTTHKGTWIPVRALSGTNGPTIMMKKATPNTVLLRTIQDYNTEDLGELATAVAAWLRNAQEAPKGTEVQGSRPTPSQQPPKETPQLAPLRPDIELAYIPDKPATGGGEERATGREQGPPEGSGRTGNPVTTQEHPATPTRPPLPQKVGNTRNRAGKGDETGNPVSAQTSSAATPSRPPPPYRPTPLPTDSAPPGKGHGTGNPDRAQAATAAAPAKLPPPYKHTPPLLHGTPPSKGEGTGNPDPAHATAAATVARPPPPYTHIPPPLYSGTTKQDQDPEGPHHLVDMTVGDNAYNTYKAILPDENYYRRIQNTVEQIKLAATHHATKRWQEWKEDDDVKPVGYKVTVCGSWAHGRPTKDSDIDVVVKRNQGDATFQDLREIATLTRKYLDRYAGTKGITGHNISVRRAGNELMNIVAEEKADKQTADRTTTNELAQLMGTNTIQITHDDHILQESRETNRANCEEQARHAILTHALMEWQGDRGTLGSKAGQVKKTTLMVLAQAYIRTHDSPACLSTWNTVEKIARGMRRLELHQPGNSLAAAIGADVRGWERWMAAREWTSECIYQWKVCKKQDARTTDANSLREPPPFAVAGYRQGNTYKWTTGNTRTGPNPGTAMTEACRMGKGPYSYLASLKEHAADQPWFVDTTGIAKSQPQPGNAARGEKLVPFKRPHPTGGTQGATDVATSSTSSQGGTNQQSASSRTAPPTQSRDRPQTKDPSETDKTKTDRDTSHSTAQTAMVIDEATSNTDNQKDGPPQSASSTTTQPTPGGTSRAKANKNTSHSTAETAMVIDADDHSAGQPDTAKRDEASQAQDRTSRHTKDSSREATRTAGQPTKQTRDRRAPTPRRTSDEDKNAKRDTSVTRMILHSDEGSTRSTESITELDDTQSTKSTTEGEGELSPSPKTPDGRKRARGITRTTRMPDSKYDFISPEKEETQEKRRRSAAPTQRGRGASPDTSPGRRSASTGSRMSTSPRSSVTTATTNTDRSPSYLTTDAESPSTPGDHSRTPSPDATSTSDSPSRERETSPPTRTSHPFAPTPREGRWIYYRDNTLVIEDKETAIRVKEGGARCHCKDCPTDMGQHGGIMCKTTAWTELTHTTNGKRNITTAGAKADEITVQAWQQDKWDIDTTQMAMDVLVNNVPGPVAKARRRKIRIMSQEDVEAIKDGESREPYDTRGDREWAIGLTLAGTGHVEPFIVHRPKSEDGGAQEAVTTIYTRAPEAPIAARHALGPSFDDERPNARTKHEHIGAELPRPGNECAVWAVATVIMAVENIIKTERVANPDGTTQPHDNLVNEIRERMQYIRTQMTNTGPDTGDVTGPEPDRIVVVNATDPGHMTMPVGSTQTATEMITGKWWNKLDSIYFTEGAKEIIEGKSAQQLVVVTRTGDAEVVGKARQGYGPHRAMQVRTFREWRDNKQEQREERCKGINKAPVTVLHRDSGGKVTRQTFQHSAKGPSWTQWRKAGIRVIGMVGAINDWDTKRVREYSRGGNTSSNHETVVQTENEDAYDGKVEVSSTRGGEHRQGTYPARTPAYEAWRSMWRVPTNDDTKLYITVDGQYKPVRAGWSLRDIRKKYDLIDLELNTTTPRWYADQIGKMRKEEEKKTQTYPRPEARHATGTRTTIMVRGRQAITCQHPMESSVRQVLDMEGVPKSVWDDIEVRDTDATWKRIGRNDKLRDLPQQNGVIKVNITSFISVGADQPKGKKSPKNKPKKADPPKQNAQQAADPKNPLAPRAQDEPANTNSKKDQQGAPGSQGTQNTQTQDAIPAQNKGKSDESGEANLDGPEEHRAGNDTQMEPTQVHQAKDDPESETDEEKARQVARKLWSMRNGEPPQHAMGTSLDDATRRRIEAGMAPLMTGTPGDEEGEIETVLWDLENIQLLMGSAQAYTATGKDPLPFGYIGLTEENSRRPPPWEWTGMDRDEERGCLMVPHPHDKQTPGAGTVYTWPISVLSKLHRSQGDIKRVTAMATKLVINAATVPEVATNPTMAPRVMHGIALQAAKSLGQLGDNPPVEAFVRHLNKRQIDLQAYIQNNPDRMTTTAHMRGTCPRTSIIYDQNREQFEPRMCRDLVRRFNITDEYDTDGVSTVFRYAPVGPKTRIHTEQSQMADTDMRDMGPQTVGLVVLPKNFGSRQNHMTFARRVPSHTLTWGGSEDERAADITAVMRAAAQTGRWMQVVVIYKSRTTRHSVIDTVRMEQLRRSGMRPLNRFMKEIVRYDGAIPSTYDPTEGEWLEREYASPTPYIAILLDNRQENRRAKEIKTSTVDLRDKDQEDVISIGLEVNDEEPMEEDQDAIRIVVEFPGDMKVSTKGKLHKWLNDVDEECSTYQALGDPKNTTFGTYLYLNGAMPGSDQWEIYTDLLKAERIRTKINEAAQVRRAAGNGEKGPYFIDETTTNNLYTVQQNWMEKDDPDKIRSCLEIEEVMHEQCPRLNGNMIALLHGYRPLDPYRFLIHLKDHADPHAVTDFLDSARKIKAVHVVTLDTLVGTQSRGNQGYDAMAARARIPNPKPETNRHVFFGISASVKPIHLDLAIASFGTVIKHRGELHAPVKDFYMEPTYVTYVKVEYQNPLSSVIATGIRMKTPSGHVHATTGSAERDAASKNATDEYIREKYRVTSSRTPLEYRVNEGSALGGATQRKEVMDRKAKAAREVEVTKEEQLLRWQASLAKEEEGDGEEVSSTAGDHMETPPPKEKKNRKRNKNPQTPGSNNKKSPDNPPKKKAGEGRPKSPKDDGKERKGDEAKEDKR